MTSALIVIRGAAADDEIAAVLAAIRKQVRGGDVRRWRRERITALRRHPRY